MQITGSPFCSRIVSVSVGETSITKTKGSFGEKNEERHPIDESINDRSMSFHEMTFARNTCQTEC